MWGSMYAAYIGLVIPQHTSIADSDLNSLATEANYNTQCSIYVRLCKKQQHNNILIQAQGSKHMK